MSELRFEGRVAVVTGAGGGLGKSYALLLASRGASVVVNDLGGTKVGEGHSTSAADLVVSEIKANGGRAVADYNSVEDGHLIIKTALDAFGRVDIVINNAGILRDKTFSKMTDADFDIIIRVHLRGSYKVTKAAWEVMKTQGYGRIVMTASAAGLYGNFGQANYSSAKMALVGFASSLAQEGEKFNIKCNTVAPLAFSRLTESVFPQEMLNAMKPEYVSAVTCFLCHESCPENGSLFETAAGFVSKLRYERNQGVLFRLDKHLSPDGIQQRWTDITQNFANAEHPTRITEVDWVGKVEKSLKLVSQPSPERLRFDGQVVVITGAGQGLGRAYAHYFAKLGAKLVVNDLGVSTSGNVQQSTVKVADEVVQELKQLYNCSAVANYDSVENGQQIIKTAMDAFQRVDVLINNAGILRDKSFSKMTDQDFDLVLKVHLYGTFSVIKAAWEIMKQQNYGRIINTTSAVGLYGNFGQANYSAAKAGIIGLSKALAIEGKKYHILVNVIAPNAGTRMTATIMPPEMVEALKPDFIAPFVAFLAHSANSSTGDVFEVGSGWIARVRWQKSLGHRFLPPQAITLENIARNWHQAVDFSRDSSSPNSIEDATKPLYDMIMNKTTKDTAALSLSNELHSFQFTQRDWILYNLAVGATRRDLHWIYENDPSFSVIPLFVALPALAVILSLPLDNVVEPFNPAMSLHGEHFAQVIRQGALPQSGDWVTVATIVDVIEKEKAVLVVVGLETKDKANQEVIAYNEATLFLRGSKIRKDFDKTQVQKKRQHSTDAKAPQRPQSAPDKVQRSKTVDEQAAWYRLTGDRNPLHIDPQVASLAGFDKPILHGMCTFGYAIRHVMQAYGLTSERIQSMSVRFSSHTFPGDQLETEMWKIDSFILFQTRNIDRGTVVLTHGVVILRSESGLTKKTMVPVSNAMPSEFQCTQYVTQMRAGLDTMSDSERNTLGNLVKGSFQFHVEQAEQRFSWFIDFKSNEKVIGVGVLPSEKTDVTLVLKDGDLVDVFTGKLSGQKAFTAGKLKISGNMMLVMKLDVILKETMKKSKM